MPKIAESRKLAMRQEIYEAAVRVLMRYGVESTTMEKVAEEAGAAKGSLYNYFGTKSELLEYVFDKTVEPLNREIQAIVDSDKPAPERLRALLYAVFHYIDDKRKLFDFLLNQQAIQQLIHPANSSGPPLIEQLLIEGMQLGDFRKCDPKIHAALIYGAMRGISDDYVSRDGPWPIFEIVDAIWQFCLDGLRAQPGNDKVLSDTGADK